MVDVVSWQQFYNRFQWRNGQHVSIIGPTGSGKSTLALALLPKKKYVVVFATKPRDRTLNQFADTYDYEIIREWPPRKDIDKVVLWPRFNINDTTGQETAFKKAFGDIFHDGAWAVYVDEVWYMDNILGLERQLKLYWTQARSLDISLLASTQRPRDVPLVMYSQASHVFFYRIPDEEDLRRISGIGSANSAEVRQYVKQLPPHTFLYVNASNGNMMISKAPKA